MPVLLAIAEFLGTWLLVAGPVYQAAIELNEQGERIDHDGFDHVTSSVPRPQHASPAWWLIPPVAYVKQRRATRQYHDSVIEALTADQVEQFVHFTDKATGWVLVGSGGLLIALVATWNLVEATALPWWAFFPIAVIAGLLSASYTAGRMRRSRGLLQRKQPAGTGAAAVTARRAGR